MYSFLMSRKAWHVCRSFQCTNLVHPSTGAKERDPERRWCLRHRPVNKVIATRRLKRVCKGVALTCERRLDAPTLFDRCRAHNLAFARRPDYHLRCVRCRSMVRPYACRLSKLRCERRTTRHAYEHQTPRLVPTVGVWYRAIPLVWVATVIERPSGPPPRTVTYHLKPLEGDTPICGETVKVGLENPFPSVAEPWNAGRLTCKRCLKLSRSSEEADMRHRRVACPQCGAKPGAKCVGWRSKKAVHYLHYERRRAAKVVFGPRR